MQVARHSSRSDGNQATVARAKGRQAEGDERRKAISDGELHGFCTRVVVDPHGLGSAPMQPSQATEIA